MSETRSIRGEVEFDTVEFLCLLFGSNWALETNDNVILLLRSAVFQRLMMGLGLTIGSLAFCVGVPVDVYRGWCRGPANFSFTDRDRIGEHLRRHFNEILIAHFTDPEKTFSKFDGADCQRLFEIVPGLQEDCSLVLGIKDALQEGRQAVELARKPGGGWRPR